MQRALATFLALMFVLAGLVMEKSACAASPFYLTVERSYSSQEKPELRLDYVRNDAAMTLRVLRPKNLEVFLAGQIQVARSYEEPRAALNPGHFVWKGVNRIDNPLQRLRRLFSTEFLNGAGAGFDAPVRETGSRRVAAVPDAMLVKPPAGFDLLREFQIDLQRGGDKKRDSIPGFDDEMSWDSGYEQRVIRLEELPGGLYLIQAVRGRVEAQALLQVSELSVQVKQSSRELLVRAVDRELKPVEGFTVRVRNESGAWSSLPGHSDASGQWLHRAERDLDGRLVLQLKDRKGRSAFVDTEFLQTSQTDPGVFLFTDRPVFKPGEEVSFKGVVRDNLKGELVLPESARAGKPVSVKLLDETGASRGKNIVGSMTSFGTFSGKFELAETDPPGLYRVNAQVGEDEHSGELRVRDYVKPTFYMKILSEEGLLRSGQTFRARVQATRFAGGAARDARYEIFVYRKKFEAPSWVEDAGGGLSTGSDYGGQSRTGSSVNQPERLFSSAEARLASLQGQAESEGKEEGVFVGSWRSAPSFDGEGVAQIEIPLPHLDGKDGEEWVYTLMVKAMDSQGAQAVLSRNFNVTLSEVVGRVVFSRVLAKTGSDGLEALVRVTDPDGGVAENVKGGLLLTLEEADGRKRELETVDFSSNEKGLARVKLPRLKDAGRLMARARLVNWKGKPLSKPYETEQAQMVLAGESNEPIANNPSLEVVPEKTTLNQGEKTRLVLLLPKGWGAGEKGDIWLSWAQDHILKVESRKASGRVLWIDVDAKHEYGTGFYFTVTLPRPGGRFDEQTVAYRIVAAERVLKVDIKPDKSVAESLKPMKISFQASRSDGSPATHAELAVAVIDRAVLAVQPEFRPGIFEFFFPVPRLNLMTFYSDELQGYGYADEIRRPNFRLQAIKPQTTLLTKSFRDTAAWFPHVRTNAMGQAEISFQMPANLTEWLVTVVAVDTEGRVGESSSQFRTTADVVLTPQLSQFLREGDEQLGSVRVTNQSSNPAAVNMTMNIQGALKGSLKTQSSAVPAKGDALLPLVVSAVGKEGEATVSLEAQADSGLRVGGGGEFSLRLLPAGMPDVVSSRPGVSGDGRIQVSFPERAKVNSAEVYVTYGLLGAALRASRTLVTYPYGCTEQLAHSTIPNLAVLDVLAKAGVSMAKLGPFQDVLEKSRKNAASGLRKILGNQKPEGGFSMWPSDPTPSLGPTLVALNALAVARDLGFKEAGAGINKGLGWLDSLEDSDAAKVEHGGVENAFLKVFRARVEPGWSPWIRGWKRNVQISGARGLAELGGSLAFLNALQREGISDDIRRESDALRKELSTDLAAALSAFDPAAFHERRRALFVEGGELAEGLLGFSPGVASWIAHAAGALLDAGKLDARLEQRIRDALLDEMRADRGMSTFDYAQVILALRPLLAKEAKELALKTGLAAPLVRGGSGAISVRLSAIPGGFYGEISGGGKSVDGFLDLAVSELPPAARTEAVFHLEVPVEDVRPGSLGVEVERKLFVVGPNGAESIGTQLKVGDVVLSKIRLARRAVGAEFSPSRYLVVDDPVPSFAEALDDDSLALADAKVGRAQDSLASVAQVLRFPERVSRVIRVWPWAQQEFVSAWRVRAAGRASHPPAVAFDMYDERVRGNSEAGVLVAVP